MTINALFALDSLKLQNGEQTVNIRKITSLTMLISFILCILTSIILFIVPHGRVAYWANWKLWGLSKTQWSELHLNLGILLLLAGLLHIYYNWKPITTYLKTRAKTVKVFTVNFNIALIFTLIVGLGTFFQIPPMSTIINISTSIKDSAGIKYGEPPYGHAELSSLKRFTKMVDLDLLKSIERLQQAGIQLENDSQTILDIASINNRSPKQIFAIIDPEPKEMTTGTKPGMPKLPPPGFGKKRLSEVCTDFGLELPVILSVFSEKGITGTPEQNIKEIAAANNIEPMVLFEIIKETDINP